jgi:hypothetical protein
MPQILFCTGATFRRHRVHLHGGKFRVSFSIGANASSSSAIGHSVRTKSKCLRKALLVLPLVMISQMQFISADVSAPVAPRTRFHLTLVPQVSHKRLPVLVDAPARDTQKLSCNGQE